MWSACTSGVHFAILLLLVFGCSQPSPVPDQTDSPDSQTVVTTSVALAEVATRLNSGTIPVLNVIPADKLSPDWRPRKASVRSLQQATLVLLNGAGWEPWTERVSLASSRTLETSAAASSRWIQIPDAVTHQHGPEGSHSHAGTVWSTWLSPELFEVQIAEVESRFVKNWPERRTEISRAAGQLRSELQPARSLCQTLREHVSRNKLSIIADSPCWLYLMRDTGLEGSWLHWPASGELSEFALQELTTANDKLPADVPKLFLLNRRQSAAAEKARQLGFRVVLLDDCILSDSEHSVLQRIAANVTQLHKAATEAF